MNDNPEVGYELIPFTTADLILDEGRPMTQEEIDELRRNREHWEREIKPRIEAFHSTNLYMKLDEILDEIQDRNDSIETTARQHVISFIVCNLKIADLLKENDESEKYPRIKKPTE